MRLAVLAFVAFIATGCTSKSDSGKDEVVPAAFLEISVSPGGESPTKLWTLHCPGGGTLPRPTRACARLARLEAPFAPVPRDVACTEIYGGPQTAEVHGMFRGERIDARFNRTNGCEIERWDKVQFLFPGT